VTGHSLDARQSPPQDAVAQQAAANPRGLAVASDGMELTWAQLDERVEDTAKRLATLDFGPTRAIGASLAPDIGAAVLIGAADRLNAPLIVLPDQVPDAERAAMAARAGISTLVSLAWLDATEPARSLPDRHLGTDDVRTILFTSGSSGTPTGVVLTRGNLQSSASAAGERLRITTHDRWLACLPVHHVGGFSIFSRSSQLGCAVVTLDAPHFDARGTADIIERERLTIASLVPTMLRRMLDEGWRGSPSMRLVLIGGGPITEHLLDRALDHGIPVATTYGLTEASSQVTTLPPWDMAAHRGTVGQPLPHVELAIGEDPEHQEPIGTAGRIWVKGAIVVRSSLEGPLTTGDGWLATGDLGRLDMQGYLSVLGRADQVILSGGEKVIPQEVEGALAAHPDVADVAVVGVEDPEWGQQAVAVLSARTDRELTVDALRAFLKRDLAPYKIPRTFVFLVHFPSIGPGKVDHVAIRACAEQAVAAAAAAAVAARTGQEESA